MSEAEKSIPHIILRNLSHAIDPKIVSALIGTYERLIVKHRKGDLEGCLGAAGKFVEHTLRAIEFIRTGNVLPEIKSASSTVKEIEKDPRLLESVRLLIPRVANAMIYDIRSKRGAIHVKEIDPRHIDASLAVQAASWVIAEFLRLYHSGSEKAVAEAMAALMRGHVPFVETFGDECVVTRNVSCNVELLLILAKVEPDGLDRKMLGQASKYAPPTVTRTIQRMEAERYIHRTRDGRFHITGPGEQFLTEQLAADGRWSSPLTKRA